MKIQYKILTAVLCLCFLSGCSNQHDSPNTSHEVSQVNDGKISLLWAKDSVYPVWNTFDTTIDASNNKVCFLGGSDNSIDSNVVCLDGKNGKLLWQKQSGNHNSIVMTPDAIFVSYSNMPGIRKYDNSGKEVWSEYLPGTGTDYLYVIGGQLQILTVPENFRILDFQGNTINNIEGNRILVSTPGGEFVALNGIQFVKMKKGEPEVIWKYGDLDDVLEMAPLFTGTQVFIRTGQQSGSIYSLDRETGGLLWKSNDNIISNVVYSPAHQAIYALSRDGRLLSMDTNDGSVDILARFSAAPFLLNGEGEVGSYQLAYDQNESVLFVSTGDSRQLFAFQER